MEERRVEINCRVPDEKRLNWAREVAKSINNNTQKTRQKFMRGKRFIFIRIKGRDRSSGAKFW